MTPAEHRIAAFLLTHNPSRLDELPDWFLALVEGDGRPEPSRELITAASLMFVRRGRPDLKFAQARDVLQRWARDPVKAEELAGRVTAFRLSCCFERLKRAGLYEDVVMDDPFDLDGSVAVALTEEDWRFFNGNPTEEERRAYAHRRAQRFHGVDGPAPARP